MEGCGVNNDNLIGIVIYIILVSFGYIVMMGIINGDGDPDLRPKVIVSIMYWGVFSLPITIPIMIKLVYHILQEVT